MDLIVNKSLVVLSKDESDISNTLEHTNWVLSKYSIEIKQTRISNLFFDLTFDKTEIVPHDIMIHFKNDENESTASQYHSLITKQPKLPQDGNRLTFRLYSEGHSFYNKIGFSVKEIKNDIRFEVEISHIYTYQVYAQKFIDEFYMNQGHCKHNIGDNFKHPSKSKVEATVMDIDADNKIIYCSATGFLH